jgi:hypothetical protein
MRWEDYIDDENIWMWKEAAMTCFKVQSQHLLETKENNEKSLPS